MSLSVVLQPSSTAYLAPPLIDILIEATPHNARRLLDALIDAGLGTAHLITAEELLAEEITVFKDRVRIDVQRQRRV